MRKFKIANLFLIFLIAGSMLTACGPKWEDLAKQRNDLVSRIGTERVRMERSTAEVKKRSGDFPASHTKALEPQLVAANEALANIGSDSVGWLSELNTAITEKDKKTAQDRLGKIQSALDTVSTYTNQILGPPGSSDQGLYDTLQDKVDLLHSGYVTGVDTRDLLQETKDLDSTTLVAVQAAAPFALCGSQSQMSYKDAHASYGSGVASIRSAEQYIASGDEPAASDALVDAMRQFSAANGSVTTAASSHQMAVDSIDSAKSTKVLADTAVLYVFVDYWTKVSSEHSSGVTDLASAQNACETEDFSSSVSYGDNARRHFDSAVYWSTQEEPEETYTPPSTEDDSDWWSDPVPSNNDSTDYSDDGGSDYSDDGGYDYSDDGGSDYSDDGGSDYSDDGGSDYSDDGGYDYSDDGGY